MFAIRLQPTLALAAALSTPFAALAQEPTAAERALQNQIRAANVDLADARVSGLKSVSVNGVELPTDAVLRETIYLIGAKQVDAKIADFFIAEQIQEAIAGGRAPTDFNVPEEELTADVAKLMGEFQKKNPGVSLWEAVRVQFGMDQDRYLHSRKQTILFDRVFFPGPASEWPDVTREAIKASAQGGDGDAFWNNIQKASAGPDGVPRELPAFWMQLCRGWVQKQLKAWSDIRYPSDGLPADVCLRVNDKDWSTEEAFGLVRHGLYTQDIEQAMTEVVVREALRQELVKAGSYLSDEEFRQQFDDYSQQFAGTPFNIEVIAVNFKGYPSLEAFRQRWRLIRSFENMITAEVTDDALREHAERFAAFFGNGTVVAEVIPFMGRDLQTGAWLPGGMAAAKVRADAAMKEIENGATFEAIQTSKGEFYGTDKDRGRLTGKSMNQLRQALRENEFTDLLSGSSVGQFLFFDAEPGAVYGPLEGTDSYYIGRVNTRVPVRGGVSIEVERTHELVRQDYVNFRFREWANRVVAAAVVQ